MLCSVCQFPNPDAALFCTSCGSPLTPPELAPDAHFLPPRTSLHGGAFIIEDVLGAGGFGLTYRAREAKLGREVALKEFFPFGSTRQNGRVVPPSGVSAEEWTRELGAFREEALTLARFSHPAIVRAYAVWAQGGTAYFAMEFLRGESLQKRLDSNRGKALPVEEALGIIENIGEALERVHEAGLLHRDIKPDNILLCEGRAVLIDFGTARAFASDKTTPMTQLLTPGYAPLEQYGKRARFGPYTDVYALTATLYHALAGSAPPSAPDRASGVELRPLEELNPRVSPRLARAVEVALEISVPKRPQTVRDWLAILREAQKPLAPPVPTTPQPAAPPAATSIPFPASVAPQPTPASTFPQPLPAPQPFPAPRTATPRPVAPDVPIEIPPDARTPIWFWPCVFGVPLLLLTFWWFHDPARGDLRSFDSRVRPILALSQSVQSTLSQLDSTSPQTYRAAVETRVLPVEQRIFGNIGALAPVSDEALFSRDQLLDAEAEKVSALQSLAQAQTNSDQQSALESLKSADNDRAIWRADYEYLMRQHRVR